jgi:hypothetical protein
MKARESPMVRMRVAKKSPNAALAEYDWQNPPARINLDF